jgi:hypothetical protein
MEPAQRPPGRRDLQVVNAGNCNRYRELYHVLGAIGGMQH